MSENCIFCKIVRKEIPSKLIKEDDEYFAINDINPQAPTHILIIPKEHVDNIVQFQSMEKLGRLFQKAKELVEIAGLKNGFRLVINTGDDGGQTVNHLHIHLLGGRALKWPPG